MPTLRHYQQGESFDILKSDVAAWLVEQAPIRQWLFNMMKWHQVIVYDSGRWRGALSKADTHAINA